MTLKLLTTFSLLGGLMGCSSLQPPGPPDPVAHGHLQPQELSGPSRSARLIDSIYGLARQAHGSGQVGMAGARYERVLSLQADHLGALNGLGVIRAQDGRTPEARELFQRASSLTPLAAHVHNNLGYLLLGEDRLDEAEAALQRAHALEPESAQTVRNLARLAQARGQQAVARHAVSEPPGQGPAVVAVAPNIFELRLPTPAPLPAGVSTSAGGMPGAAAPDWQALESGMKLEIANGVGTPRLATRTARRLATLGVSASRLTNARPYQQAQTQLQYLPGQEALVQALLARLPVPVEPVRVASLGGRVDVRLVLGHDQAGRTIANWAEDTAPTRMAAPAPADGAASVPTPGRAMANSRPS